MNASSGSLSGVAPQLLALACAGGVGGLMLGWVLIPAGMIACAIGGAMTCSAIRVAVLLAGPAPDGQTDQETPTDY